MYILTQSGREVGPETGIPSLEDIARGLARQPRFGGQSRCWWSVAHHSIFVADLLRLRERKLFARQPEWEPLLILYGLLHDAHEAVTGDVPTPFKTPILRYYQRRLDERILQEHVPALYRRMHDPLAVQLIHTYDRQALLAEALRVGPLPLRTHEDVAYHFGEWPSERALEIFDVYNAPPMLNVAAGFLGIYRWQTQRLAQMRVQ